MNDTDGPWSMAWQRAHGCTCEPYPDPAKEQLLLVVDPTCSQHADMPPDLPRRELNRDT